MALLDGDRERRRDPRSRAATALLVLSVFLAGCALMEAWGVKEDSSSTFNHSVHVIDNELECSFCHDPETEGGPPTIPPLEFCSLCHSDEDVEKDPEDRASWFYDEEGNHKGQSIVALDEELIFDHGAHVELAGDDCLVCHEGYDESERILVDDAFSMDECSACHDALGVDDACSVCHSVIDENWVPESHGQAWERLHGQAFRMRQEAITGRCEVCHSESTCNSCHQSETPRNHDNFWRLRGHAVPATLDRDNCAVCHRDDGCIRCHEDTQPLNHKGSFGSPRNNHCLGCHFPLSSSGCLTCHKSTPSHNQAPDQPPDHVPGADCRACHGRNAPLRHVDDGSDCNACHR